MTASPASSTTHLTEGQQRALDMVIRATQSHEPAVCVVGGYAGTGKTFLVRTIAEECGTPRIITPTGKAALRVRELTGLDASTIHRWLYKPMEDRDTGVIKFHRAALDEIEIPASRIVVLDEASMVGADIARDVFQVCKDLYLTLVVVGDLFQLPPVVPPGSPPFSLLSPGFAQSIGAERVELTEILRQAQDSPIIRASMRLRQGERMGALQEIPFLGVDQLWTAAYQVFQAGGITVCHKNATRFQLNAGLRQMFGYSGMELPQPGEPLLVLKNNYDLGYFNGETVLFEKWVKAPADRETIRDRYKNITEYVKFGCATVGDCRAIMAVEELHGRLSSGLSTISRGGKKWALREGVWTGDQVASQLHANFGYCYTAHKSQGSQWPYVLVILESSIRLNEEEGRRWTYTAITRAEKTVAIYPGGV